MSHTKYTTEAIVLSGVDTGEADRYIQILTRDFGLIGVHARGVRKIFSKQRSFLQPLSFPIISLIRGRNMWRLAHVKENTSFGFSDNQKVRPIGARVASFLKRFIKGEDPHHDLFDSIKEGFLFIINNDLDEAGRKMAEDLMILRALFHLGYISSSEVPKGLIASTEVYSKDILEEILNNKTQINTALYQAFEESGL